MVNGASKKKVEIMLIYLIFILLYELISEHAEKCELEVYRLGQSRLHYRVTRLRICSIKNACMPQNAKVCHFSASILWYLYVQLLYGYSKILWVISHRCELFRKKNFLVYMSAKEGHFFLFFTLGAHCKALSKSRIQR